MITLNQYLQPEFPLRLTLAADDMQDYEFEGYASVFGVVNSYGFAIDAGAFTKTLKENPNPVILWQHWSDEPIGVITSAEEDKKGLKIRGKLVPEVKRAQEAYALMKAEAVRGMSIGFFPVKYAVDHEKNIDHLTEVKLREVSLVTFPADPKARVGRVLSELNMLSPQDRQLSRDEIQATIVRLNALLDATQPAPATASAIEPRQLAELSSLITDIRDTQRRLLS